MSNGLVTKLNEEVRLDRLKNLDFIAIVNSVDLLTNDAVFCQYEINGNGIAYPEQTSKDLNSLLSIITPLEMNQGRLPFDIPTIIDYNGKTVWDSPGVGGLLVHGTPMDLK